MEDQAFLVRMSISQWTARKLDKRATNDTKVRAGAGTKAGVKVYKSIIAADELDAIATIAGAAYIEHRKRTVPWAYDGPGAITAEGYPSYKAAMTLHEKAFHAAVATFINSYTQDRQTILNDSTHPMRRDLGNLFNPADYPSPEELRTKFAFTMSAEPMPKPEHFNARLPLDVVNEIRHDIVANNAQALDNANDTAWGRVVEVVEKLKLRLAEYTSGKVTKFYDSWLDNVKELITLIPSVNVANDPELARVAQRLMALTVYTSADLKDSVTLRDNIVREAGVILAGINEAYRKAA